MSDNALKNKDSFRRLDALTVATVAEAKALQVPIGTKVVTSGYYEAGDGGGNDYIVVAGGTGTDDGGSFIDLDNGLQLKALFPDEVNVKQFGATGDGTNTDRSSFQNANDYLVSIGSYRLNIPAGIYAIDGQINIGVELHGINARSSIIKHTSSSPSKLAVLSGASGRLIHCYGIGFWGQGVVNGSWPTQVLVSLTDTTRGWDLINCEIGRYAIDGYGAEVGLEIDGFSYYKNVQGTLFDYNKFAVSLSNSGNDLGRQFTDCRFEHCYGHTAVLLKNQGKVKFNGCAFQFNDGSCVSTAPDTVDETNKIISGNLAFGVCQFHECTFEKNNRGAWEYVLDGISTVIGYICILNGEIKCYDGFATASLGEFAQFVLTDNCTEIELKDNKCSSSAIYTFLKGGNSTDGDIIFKNNKPLGSATTTQYELSSASARVLSFKSKDTAVVDTIEASLKARSQISQSNLNPSSFTSSVFIDCSSGNRTVNLINVKKEAGKIVLISKTDNSANTLTVVDSNANINGSSIEIISNIGTKTLISDGVNWFLS